MTHSGQPVVFVGDDPAPPRDLEAAFDVVAFRDRTGAVDRVETTAVGCVVVDGTDAERVATVAAVRDADPSVPIIYVTAVPDGTVAAAATRAGATEYFARTADETLADRIAALSAAGMPPSAAGLRNEGTDIDPHDQRRIDGAKTREEHSGRTSRSERDAILGRIHAIIADDDPFEDRVEELLSVGRTALDVEYGTVSRIDGQQYTFEHVSGVDDLITGGETLHLSEAYCDRIVDTGESLSVTDVTDQRPELTDRGAFQAYGISCFLGIPVTVDGELWGTLCFFDRSARPAEFSEWERTVVELLANRIGRELEQQSRRRELERVRTSRERTLERLDDAFLAVDEDWRLTALHGWAETLLAHDAASVGTSLWEAVPDAIGRDLEDRYQRAMADETPVTLEEYAPSLEQWLQIRLYPSETGLSVYVTDVTERREREAELQRYERIVETIDDGVLVIDSDQRFVHANDAFADLVGTDRETLVGMHASSLVDDAAWNDWIRVAMSLAAGDTDHETYETELQRVDGGTVSIEAKITPLQPNDTDDIAFVCIVRDVAERNRRADIVTELLETTRALFSCDSHTDVANVVVEAAERVLGFDVVTIRRYDPETEELVLTAASDAISDLFSERKRVDIDGGRMGEAFRKSDPIIFEDLQTDESVARYDYEAFRGAMCIPIGDRGILNVGSPVSGAFDDHHLQLAQLLTASAAAALERADRREDLLRHERVLETVEGMVYAIDGEARFTLVTDPLAERLGYDREELLGEHVSLVFDDREYDRAEEHVRGLLADPQQNSGSFEAAYTTADGERFPVEIECSLLPRDEDGAYGGSVSVVRDITERKEREQYLQVLNRVLRHNLRNDLTVVIGYAEQLRDHIDDGDLATAAETLRETATDLARTSEKTRAIQYALERDGDLEPVDVAAIVDAAVSESDIDNATVSVSTADSCWAWADPGLTLVVDNLLENAARHTGSTPTIDVAVTRDDEQVRLSVADDGPGIPPAEIDVVTGESDITQLTHSSGLGLWLVRWMVESYGGSVSFSQSAMGGSRVEVSLEAAPAEPTDDT